MTTPGAPTHRPIARRSERSGRARSRDRPRDRDTGSGTGLSRQADQDHRAGGSWRPVRPARPAGIADHSGKARSAGDHRESSGCRRRHRRARGRRRTGRRLHPDDRQHQHARGSSVGLGKRRLRPRQGLHADREGHGGVPDPRGASIRPVDVAQATGGLCQGQPRHAQLCAYRRGRVASSRRRAVHVAQWHQDDRSLLPQRRGVRAPPC